MLERKIAGGASWFYWIAGLSAINTILAYAGAEWGFVIGLGITQFIDAIGVEFGAAGMGIAIVLDLLVMGLFVLFGKFAHRLHAWAFITGMVLYAFDGGLLFLIEEWVGLGFHVLALFYLFNGLKALFELKKLRSGQ